MMTLLRRSVTLFPFSLTLWAKSLNQSVCLVTYIVFSLTQVIAEVTLKTRSWTPILSNMKEYGERATEFGVDATWFLF